MTALSDLINRELERRGWSTESLRSLRARSEERLSKDAIRLYRAGRHGTPTEEVLWAWSDLLEIPVSELRAAAGVPAGTDQPYVPPAAAARLSQRQRTALDELILSFVGEYRTEITFDVGDDGQLYQAGGPDDQDTKSRAEAGGSEYGSAGSGTSRQAPMTDRSAVDDPYAQDIPDMPVTHRDHT